MMNGAELAVEEVAQIQDAAVNAVRIVFALIVPISVVTLSLSFFPPNVYLERVRRRAAATA